MKNMHRLTKLQIRVEYKLPDGTGWIEIGIHPSELMLRTQMEIDERIDAHVRERMEKIAIPDSNKPLS